jgi:hypothetical protein
MPGTRYAQPILGLVAFGVSFLSQWLGHSAFTLIHGVFGDYHYYASLLTGIAGALLIGRGLKQGEIAATWMGFLGAQFVWLGCFELTFEFYAEFFSFPAYEAGPRLVAPGDANMLMATMPIMMAMFLIYGFYNRQTRCNLIRWFHRNLRLTPGVPTPDNGRSFSRIVAMETLFVIWFCYLFWLYVAYIGANQNLMAVAYVTWAVWFFYIFWKLFKFPRVGSAFRYAIPVGIVGWGLIEMPSYMGFYDEVWLKPFQYPITTLIATGLYIAGLVYLANPPERAPRTGEPAATVA